ncbi:MAG: homocysteine S-methyltransferase family protein [Rhodobacterales bacterium]|nr:homocysteine S-methyltransferase family protein [Rhodobacterales bacterium]NCT12991.1 homocysteine S-methyltransferase family protein [Rhodobacterales bacterium]
MADVILLDGGMGQELIHRAGDRPTPLWSTQVMMEHPGMVAAVHGDYFAAGATVATTNTYCIHHDRLEPAGLDGDFRALHDAALAAAQGARQAAGHGRIAGSIGPLVASYRPEVHPPHAEAVAKYAEVARVIAPQVDLILCETVASLAHARAVLEGALTAGLPVWLSVTVGDRDGSLLRSGEPVAAAGALAAAMGAQAVLANCSAPEAMAAAMEALRPAGLPFGAYANGFTQITEDFLKDRPTVDALSARRDLGPDAYAAFALGWVRQGATIVGGCCEVGPAHIAAVARGLTAEGHRIV